MPKKKVTEAVEETAQETIPVEKAPAQMPRRQGSEDLLELNDLNVASHARIVKKRNGAILLAQCEDSRS